jgi:hypothetical protein
MMCETLPLANICLAKTGIWWKKSDTKTIGDDGGSEMRSAEIARDNGIKHPQLFCRAASLLVSKVGEFNVGLTLPTTHCIPFTLSMSQHEDARWGGHYSIVVNGLGGLTLLLRNGGNNFVKDRVSKGFHLIVCAVLNWMRRKDSF